MEFEVRTLSDRLVDVVRDIILTESISPDVPIRQDALAAQLRVSKIPLREALVRLAQDGLVVSHANRGFFVRPMSWDEAEEVYALRLKIEPDAAAFACLKATDADAEAARQALNRLDADAAAQKPTVGALNRAFHLALVRPGEQQITTSMVERLHVVADRYVRKHLEPLGRHVRAEAEHEEILKTWIKRDADTVRKLVHRHLVHTLEDLRRQFTAGEAAQDAPKSPDGRRRRPKGGAGSKK